MTFDRRASSKPFHHFLRDAEMAFLKEVAKDTNASRYLAFKVEPGVSVPMLSFKGYDRSDLEVEGFLSLAVLDNNEVKVFMDMKHAQYGIKKDELKLKTGVMTPELVVKRLNEFVLGA
jgi:hypothetical protein